MGKWTYSDGTEVTIRDVALSVKRMLLHRPNFPVLRYIVGKQDWIMLKEPLKNEIPGDLIAHFQSFPAERRNYHPRKYYCQVA